MSRLLLVPVGFYVLSTGLGVLLRFFFVRPFAFPVFGNGVHAHSHTLYFGWGALALFALMLRALGSTGRLTRFFLGAVVAISAATFVSFLEGGYSTPSIVVSAISLLVWPVGVAEVWRRARARADLAAIYFRTAMAYVVFASLGAATRAIFIALDASAYAKSLAVFAFLHGFSWFFVFGVLGVLLHEAGAFGIRLDERSLALALKIAAPLAWLTFPLGVPQGSEGVLGLVARAASVVLLVFGLVAARALWRAGKEGRDAHHLAFCWLGFWLGLDASLAAVGALGLSELAVRSRHLAILYLHVRLVGFVSLGVMLAIFAGRRSPFGPGMWLHNLGLLVMLAGLGVAGLPATGWSIPPLLLRLSLPVAAVGGAVTALAGAVWLVQLVAERRSARSALADRAAVPR